MRSGWRRRGRTQQGQVRYRFAAVGEHDREIDRDPAWAVPGPTRSQLT